MDKQVNEPLCLSFLILQNSGKITTYLVFRVKYESICKVLNLAECVLPSKHSRNIHCCYYCNYLYEPQIPFSHMALFLVPNSVKGTIILQLAET